MHRKKTFHFTVTSQNKIVSWLPEDYLPGDFKNFTGELPSSVQ